MINIILSSLWFILPAGFANMAPVLLTKFKIIKKYNFAIDLGKKFNGRRILGEGKTWLGFILGGITGGIIGFAQSLAQPSIPIYYLPNMTLKLGLLLGFGALTGDLLGSLIKRRLEIGSGERAPLLDQLDFILGAFLFGSLIFFEIRYLLILVILIPAIHLLLNKISYEMGLKENPW